MANFARRAFIPESAALVLLGLVIGTLAPGVRSVISADAVLFVLVPGLVFDAAFDLEWPLLRRMLPALVGLALPGVFVSALVVALLLNTIVGLPIGLALVVGAIVSATDPVAVVTTLKSLDMPRSLRTLVEGESLLNDGTGLALVAIAVAAATEGTHATVAAATFAVVIVASVALGYAVGRIGTAILRAVRTPTAATVLSVAYAYACFAGATLIGLSGVLVTVIAAIVMGHALRDDVVCKPIATSVDRVWAAIALVLSALAFLAIGGAIDVRAFGSEIGAIAVGVLATLVARALFVYVPYLLVRSAPLGWAHVLFWSGLRGAIAFAAALSLPTDLPQRQFLQTVAFGVVLITLVGQGATAPLVVGAALRSVSGGGATRDAAGEDAPARERSRTPARMWTRLLHIRLLFGLFILGACASGYAAITLAWPGTALDFAWTVNPVGHAGLLSLGPLAIVGMAALSMTMVATALGLIALKRWAWWVAVVGLAVNATGDLATAIATGDPRTLIGVPVAGFIVWWLTRREVRSRFG